jgi:hypothetical protein
MSIKKWLSPLLVLLAAGCAAIPNGPPQAPHRVLTSTADGGVTSVQDVEQKTHLMRLGGTPPAQQVINIGTAANSGNGDPIRTAFTKDNTNTTALFSMFGTSSNLYNNGTALATDIAGLFTGCGPSTPALGYQGACVSGGGGGGTPGGSNLQIQYNNAGSFGGYTPAGAIGYLDSGTANAQTGTTYTLVSGDANSEVTMSNASANTLTIPANATVAFATGTIITVQELSTGITSIAPASGVTIESPTYGASTSQQYSLGGIYGQIQLQKVATNTWNVILWQPGKTTYTLSGTCTTSASTGGNTGGHITMSGTGSCTLIVTPGGGLQAPDYWVGRMSDTTQPTIPGWGETSSSASSVTFTVPAAVAASDVLTFTVTME